MRSDHANQSRVGGIAINPAITMYAIDVHAHFGDYDIGAGRGALAERTGEAIRLINEQRKHLSRLQVHSRQDTVR